MEDPILVAVVYATQQLLQVRLRQGCGLRGGQRTKEEAMTHSAHATYRDGFQRDATLGQVKALLQVLIQELKHKRQALVSVYYVIQPESEGGWGRER